MADRPGAAEPGLRHQWLHPRALVACGGVFGLKPTYGRLPQRIYPFAPASTTSAFARNVRDLALCYDAMQGHDGMTRAVWRARSHRP